VMDSQRSKLILASGSPRRAQILTKASIEIDVVPAEIDEGEILEGGGELRDAVQQLALAKAEAIAGFRPGEFVLGADTIVVLDGDILGKPESLEQATEMLGRLSGRQHEVVTGVAIVNPAGDTHTKHVSTSVVFRNLDDKAVVDYVSSGSPFDKAGGYGIQDRSFAPVASYDECYLNVVGLPMCATNELLEQSGFLGIGVSECAGHDAFAAGSDKRVESRSSE